MKPRRLERLERSAEPDVVAHWRRLIRPSLLPLLLLLLACVANVGQVEAQVPEDVAPGETIYRVELTDGSTLFGRVEAVSETGIVLLTEAGARVEIQRDQVRSMRPMEGEVVDGRVLLPDRNASRLFFGPTARGLPAGQGYFGVYELFFAFISYAPTDHLIVSGGTPILPFGMGEVLYLAPKINFLSRGSLDLAAGVMALFATREVMDGSAGVVYGAATKGDPNRAATLGAGWGYVWGDGDTELSDEPVIMFGFEDRVSPRVKVLSESYLFPGEMTLMVGGGVRLLGERFTGDLGIGVGAGEGDAFCCMPLVNLTYMFGGDD